MMHPDTDSSNTTSSENTEPSSEETYEVAPRQTHPISPSECNKTAFVQLTVKNSRGENIIPAGVETTQPNRGRGRPKKSDNDFQATQSKKRDADHVHESRNKRRKK